MDAFSAIVTNKVIVCASRCPPRPIAGLGISDRVHFDSLDSSDLFNLCDELDSLNSLDSLDSLDASDSFDSLD